MRAFSCVKRQSERGANLVEFALVIPLLVLMLVGVADLGRAFQTYIAVTNAAREGARLGVKNSEVTAAIRRAVARELGLDEVEDDEALRVVIVEEAASFAGVEREVIVLTVEYDYPLILGGLLGLPGGAITLRNEASMPVFEME